MTKAESNTTFSKKIRHRARILLYVMIAIAILGIGYRIIEYIILRYTTNQQAYTTVATITANKGAKDEELILPGNVSAWHDATIYARTNGYIINWLVDIGAHVKQNDLLAEISAPEVIAQLRQTEADLKTAEANYKIAQSTANRWRRLLKTASVSVQETNEKVSDAEAKAAIVKATTAERDRLLSLVSFQKVVAPFDGIIMSRTTDIGKLINAGSGTVPLFRLVQADRLRVYVRVPEYFAKNITPSITTELYFTERPDKKYPAKLLSTAKAIDQKTRTLLVELEVDNTDYELLSGSYTQVHFVVPSNKTAVILPVNTLIFRASGLQVATLDNQNKVVFKPIKLGRDFGNSVEVIFGLSPGEKIILNPSDALTQGQKVKIVSSDGNSVDKKA